MSIQEFYEGFNILYNNISSNAAPGIDKFEISFYLTKAQLEIVKEYNGIANKYQKGFEANDKRRIDLKELVEDFKSTTSVISNDRITNKLNSKFFTIPDDVFLTKYEKGIYNNGNCNIEIDIIPITLDTFNENAKNPFKKPYKDLAWRIDQNLIDAKNVEIISDQNITTYHLRYIKYPEPIILVDLVSNPEFAGMNLSIDGVTTPQTCKLNKEIHPEILDRAVEMAILDYKEGNLQSRVQLNNRNN